jgi:hypothetical protein
VIGKVPYFFKRFEFVEHARDVHHHAVAHHAEALGVQDTGRHQVQSVLNTVVVVNRVACVGAALAPSDHVVFLSEVFPKKSCALLVTVLCLCVFFFGVCSFGVRGRPRGAPPDPPRVARFPDRAEWCATRGTVEARLRVVRGKPNPSRGRKHQGDAFRTNASLRWRLLGFGDVRAPGYQRACPCLRRPTVSRARRTRNRGFSTRLCSPARPRRVPRRLCTRALFAPRARDAAHEPCPRTRRRARAWARQRP